MQPATAHPMTNHASRNAPTPRHVRDVTFPASTAIVFVKTNRIVGGFAYARNDHGPAAADLLFDRIRDTPSSRQRNRDAHGRRRDSSLRLGGVRVTGEAARERAAAPRHRS